MSQFLGVGKLCSVAHLATQAHLGCLFLLYYIIRMLVFVGPFLNNPRVQGVQKIHLMQREACNGVTIDSLDLVASLHDTLLGGRAGGSKSAHHENVVGAPAPHPHINAESSHLLRPAALRRDPPPALRQPQH